jgi:hypothetical protein
VRLFPVIAGQTGAEPVFEDAADFDLEVITQPYRTASLLVCRYRSALLLDRWS